MTIKQGVCGELVLKPRQAGDIGLGRAVDHEGEVLEVFVTKQRDRKASLMFLKKAMKRYGCPQMIVTDRLRSNQTAMHEIGNETCQVTGLWLNNRAENSHQPFWRQKRAMTKFRIAKSLQKFAAVHASVHNLFNQEHYFYSRKNFKLNRSAALPSSVNLFAEAGRSAVFGDSVTLV